MSPSLIVLETQDFVAAARMLRLWVGEPLRTATDGLCRALPGCAAMAGSDPGGMAWAASYDRAVEPALQAAADAVNAVDKLAAMFTQTARNYEAADAASSSTARRLIESATATLPRAGESYWLPVCPVSARGGSGGAPHGWGLVGHLVGYAWPNGHQDRLRTAAHAWRTSAAAFAHSADDAVSAAQLAISDRLPEAGDMWTVTRALSDHLRMLADVHAGIATSCEQLAGHIDEVHSSVENELASLVAWTAGIEVAGGLLSVVSLGAAEAPTQGVEALRIASTAGRVSALIEKFIALARVAGQSVAVLAERAGAVSARLRVVLDARLTEAAVTAVGRYREMRIAEETGALGRLELGASGLPRFQAPVLRLEKKFKHARDFGVTESRGRAGFEAYRSALDAFVHSPGTTRLAGSYRGERAILNYNIESRLVVVQSVSGEFVSGWRMTATQLKYLRATRRLGGD